MINFVDSVPYVDQRDSFSLCEDEINNLFMSYMQSMVLGEMSPQDALDYFNAEAQDILADAIGG